MLKKKKLSFIFECDGKTVDLSSYDYGIIRVEGIEASEYEINSSQNSIYDGCAVYNKRVKERPISISFDYLKEEDKELKRKELISFFNPKKTGLLVAKYGEIERSIEYELEKFTAPIENVHNLLNVTVDLICPNPFWTEKGWSSTDIAYWQGAFEFILEIPIDKGAEFGTRNDELIANIENLGDVETGMIVEFKALGSVTGPSILNVMTREFIKVNRTMEAGEVITVDTRFGKKKVESLKSGDTTNIFNYIDLESTFMQLQVGDNYFKYDADQNVDNLEITIKHNNQYLGV